MGRNALIAAAVVLGVTYFTSPYLALFRISRDLAVGDVDAVRSEVDWESLRARLPDDIADRFSGATMTAAADPATLPPFASYVQGVADPTVDRAVTPEALCAAMRGAGAGPVLPLAFLGGFHGPTQFTARVARPGAPSMRIHLRLEGIEWRVTGVQLEPGART